MDFSSPQKRVFTIGTLAQEAGVNVETIRYYQKRQLLRQPQKSGNGVRYYDQNDLKRLLLIRRAKHLRFSLAEIEDLIPHIENGDCDAAKALAHHKLQIVDSQIAFLQHVRDTLTAVATSCTDDCAHSCLLLHGLC